MPTTPSKALGKKLAASPRRTHKDQAGTPHSDMRSAALSLIDGILARAAPPDLRTLLHICLQQLDEDAQKKAERERQDAMEAAELAKVTKQRENEKKKQQEAAEKKRKEAELKEAAKAKELADRLKQEADAKRSAEENWKAVKEAAAAAKLAAEQQAKEAAALAKVTKQRENEKKKQQEAAEKKRKEAELKEAANAKELADRLKKEADAKRSAEEKAVKEAAAAAKLAAEAQRKADEAEKRAKSEAETKEAIALGGAADEERRKLEDADAVAAMQVQREKDEAARREAGRVQNSLNEAEEKAKRKAERKTDEARERAEKALEEAREAAAKANKMASSSLEEGEPPKSLHDASQPATRSSPFQRKGWSRGAGNAAEEDSKDAANSDDEKEKKSGEGRGGGGAFTITYGDERTYGRGSTAADVMEEEVAAAMEAADNADGGEEAEGDEVLVDGELPAWLEPWHNWGGARSAEMDGALTVQADCLSFDGKDTLVCIGGDGDARSVSLYSLKLGHVTKSLHGHTDKVVSVACQGDLIASGSKDLTIRIWSRRSGQRTATLIGCEAPVHGLALQGALLFSGEGGGVGRGAGIARLWSLSTGKSISVFTEHQGAIWSVALEDGVGVSASHDATARVWPTNGSNDSSLGCLHHPAWVCSVSLDGNLAATGCADKRVRLWSLTSYGCTRILEHGGGGSAPVSPVFSVRLVRGGQALLSGGNDHNVKIWHLRGGSRSAEGIEDGAAGDTDEPEISVECVATLPHEENVRGLAVLPQLKCVVSAGGRSASGVVVWKPAPPPDNAAPKRRSSTGWLFSK